MPQKEQHYTNYSGYSYDPAGIQRDNNMTPSDTFYLQKRRDEDIAEVLDIVKAQGLSTREGTDMELRRRAPLPDIGRQNMDIMMESNAGTPRICLDRSMLSTDRSDSTLSNLYVSRSTSHLSASYDNIPYQTPRGISSNHGNNYRNTLSKTLMSRSMETFPKNTPRKAHRLRPMGQRRLSCVPESKHSAYGGVRTRPQEQSEMFDLPERPINTPRSHHKKNRYRNSGYSDKQTSSYVNIPSYSSVGSSDDEFSSEDLPMPNANKVPTITTDPHLQMDVKRTHRKQQKLRRMANDPPNIAMAAPSNSPLEREATFDIYSINEY